MTNNMYTHEERRTIIKYLIDNNIDGNLQGNALWKRMEQEKVLNRTWQSMRSQFKNTIINMLHLYGLSEYQRKLILHAFGRKTRSHTAKTVLPKKPIPFSSDSDSDSTICVPVRVKRARCDSGSSSSLDLLASNTNTGKRNTHASDHNLPSTSASRANRDIRSYSVNSNSKPVTSTPKVTDHKSKPEHNDPVVIIDSDDDEPIKTEVMEIDTETKKENIPFSLEEDTQLILFFKSHQCYLADIRNNFVYVAYNYETPSSIRTPRELRTRFVEHIMPRLFTYDCLTYEEMVTYYDRTDIDVPAEFQQLINKTVAEQKKHKQLTAPNVTDVPPQTERSNVDKVISTELATDNITPAVSVQVQPNPPACPERNVINATTQTQPASVCNEMVDAQTQVQLAGEDKISKPTMLDAQTQTQPPGEDKLCNNDVIVQHVEVITDNILHIFLPDERSPLQDQQNIYSKSPQKTVHFKQYTLLNDKRYVDAAVDSSVRKIAIDKCQAELQRLTAEMKRLETTLCKLKGYETTVSAEKENLVIKQEQCTNVSERSNSTIIISSSQESVSGGEEIDQTELMFDNFQTDLDKKHISTQINTSQTDNATAQDGEQQEISTVIAIQPDIEICTRQTQEQMEVEQTSSESEDPTDTSACQTEPLNLSTNSDSATDLNSDKFYTATSQHDS